MVFTTFKFIIFMAIIFFFYYAIPKKYQWLLLLFGSYVFYAQTSFYCVLFLIFTTLTSYTFANIINKYFENKFKVLILYVGVLLILMPLFVCKYGNFFINMFKSFSYNNSKLSNLVLPVGLSFYIFQSLGYCIDVYRGGVEAEKNLFKHALYVSYFPQLLQGPIGDYNRLKPQLFLEHTFNYETIRKALLRIGYGFMKKLVLANNISIIIDSIYNTSEKYQGFIFWIFISILYGIQLYADFSGYMDISIGCSKMLGISLDENFDTPYFSKSIAEFWRRWHITLGEWFKNYVFYSLLRTSFLNHLRRTTKKLSKYLSNVVPTVISLIIIWFLIGLWHGADWCYVIYGLYHGGFIILSTILAPIYAKLNYKFSFITNKKVYSIFQILRTFIIVNLGYLIFRPANLVITKQIIYSMTKSSGFFLVITLLKNNLYSFSIIILSVIVLLAVDLIMYHKKNVIIYKKFCSLPSLVRWGIYVMLILFVIYYGSYGDEIANQFAYFVF